MEFWCPECGKFEGEISDIQNSHRIICGDSLIPETYEKLMQGDKAHLILTDPPYGVDYEQGKYTGNKVEKVFQAIANDDKKGIELFNFIKDVFIITNKYATQTASLYCFSPPMTESSSILYGLIASGFHMQSQIIWEKNQFILGRRDYHWQHENIWKGEKKQKKKNENGIMWYGYIGNPHYFDGLRQQSTIWKIHKDSHISYMHPTQKPVELAERALLNSSQEGEIVLDNFTGAGFTAIACHKLKRIFRGIELEPKYVDVTVKRLEHYANTKARLIRDGKDITDETRRE